MGSGQVAARAEEEIRCPPTILRGIVRVARGRRRERPRRVLADAFAVLDQIVAARVRRGLTTVIDTLGLEPARRRGYLDLARRASLPAAVVLVDADPAEIRRRNQNRSKPVPAAAHEAQLRRMRTAAQEISGEGWDVIARADEAEVEPAHTPGTRQAAAARRSTPARLELVLQIARFGWEVARQAG